MTQNNVIDFESASRRQRERQGHASHGSRRQGWRTRYREGIDGMVTMQQVRAWPAEILPFVAARNRLPAKAD